MKMTGMFVKKYCENSGNNTMVSFPQLTIYFSYQTIIAIAINGKLYISENVWSVTTGRHLNAINSNHDIRIPNDEFERILESVNIQITLENGENENG